MGGAAVWRGRGGAEGSARRSEQSEMEAALGFVGRRWDVAGDPVRGGAWPEKGERGLPDSVWAPVWPWRILVECVTHLCT